ncbi:MAG: hypothetical protein HUJ70_15430 [Pseudobutyrivibrio sp.]|nr:hypothetical protein [Pseudobutyrivibrio sp.]
MGTPIYRTISNDLSEIISSNIDYNNQNREDLRYLLLEKVDPLEDIDYKDSDTYAYLASTINFFLNDLKYRLYPTAGNEKWYNSAKFILSGHPGLEIRSTPTLPAIQSEIDRIMAATRGTAMKNPLFREIVNRIDELVEAKRYHELELTIEDTEMNMRCFDKLKDTFAEFEADVRNYVESTRKDEFANLDFTKVGDLWLKECKNGEEIQDTLNKRKKALKTYKEENSLYSTLIRENLILSAQLKDINKNRDTLNQNSTTGNENSNILSNLIKELQTNIENHDSHAVDIDNDKMAIDAMYLQITKIQNNLKVLENFEIRTKRKLNVSDDVLEKAVKVRTLFQEHLNLGANLSNESAVSHISSLLSDCNDLKGQELRDKIDANFGKIRKSIDENTLKVTKEIVECLIFSKGMSPQSVIESTSSQNIKLLHNDVIQVVDDNMLEIEKLSKNDFKLQSDSFINEIDNICKNRKKINSLKENLNNLNNSIAAQNNKLAVSFNKIVDICSLDVISKYKNQLNDVMAKLKTMGANENSLAEVGNTLNKATSGKEALGSLVNATKMLGSINTTTVDEIESKKKDCDTKEKERHEKIVKNSGLADTLLKAKHDEISSLSAELNKSILQQDKYYALLEKQRNLYKKHVLILSDMEEANEVVENLPGEIDKAIANSVLDDMERIYRTLNDARRHKSNSQFYEKMIGPLCGTLKVAIPAYRQDLKTQSIDRSNINPSIEQLRLTMDLIKQAAQEYLTLRQDTHWYSTEQAYQRINLAKQLISMCDNAKKRMDYGDKIKKDKVIEKTKDFKKKTEIAKDYNKKFINKHKESEDPDSEANARFSVFCKLLNKVALSPKRIPDNQPDKEAKASKPKYTRKWVTKYTDLQICKDAQLSLPSQII